MRKVSVLRKYPDLLAIEDVTQILHIGRHVVYRLIKENRLKAFKIGNRYRVTKRSLISYIESSERGSDYSQKV